VTLPCAWMNTRWLCTAVSLGIVYASSTTIGSVAFVRMA
jgi:hypothetical protein